MSELRSVAEALRSETLAELPDARLVQDFRELHQAGELIEVERLRRLAEIERRGLFSQDGHLSATPWLTSEFKVSGGLASEQVRVARSLEQMPATRGALEIAAVSLSQVRVLASAREQDPKAFSRSEASLVEAARIHSVRDLQRIAADWRQKIDRESSEEKLRARRRLHASQTPVGMVRVDRSSIRRPERPCSPRSVLCLTPRLARERGIPDPPRSAGPMRWARSAGDGSISPIGPRWPGSDPT